MQRLILLFFVLLIVTSLVGCFNPIDKEPDITGYVVEKSNDNILVVSETSEDLRENGGVAEFYEMIWFSNSSNEINLGDKVDIWYNSVNQSYPAKATIKTFNIHEPDQPDDALLTESEVLEQVLSNLDIQPDQLFAIQSIQFNKSKQIWLINLMEIWTEEILTIKFPETNQP